MRNRNGIHVAFSKYFTVNKMFNFREAKRSDAAELFYRLHRPYSAYVYEDKDKGSCDLFQNLTSVHELADIIEDLQYQEDEIYKLFVLEYGTTIVGVLFLSFLENEIFYEDGSLTPYKSIYIHWRCSFARQRDLYQLNIRGVGRTLNLYLIDYARKLYPDDRIILFNKALSEAISYHQRNNWKAIDEFFENLKNSEGYSILDSYNEYGEGNYMYYLVYPVYKLFPFPTNLFFSF